MEGNRSILLAKDTLQGLVGSLPGEQQDRLLGQPEYYSRYEWYLANVYQYMPEDPQEY